jgi:ABC-2 type transport system permease protein
VAGTVLAFASLAMAVLFVPGDLRLSDATEWRQVAGVGLTYAVGMVIATALGTLLRHAAGAVSLLLIWVLVVEATVGLLPYGQVISQLMPFQALSYFIGQIDAEFAYPPVFGIVYAAAVAGALLGLSVFVAERRDAA